MPQTLTYHVERGAYFQRLVVVKDRRTHHVSPCTAASVSFVSSTGVSSTVPAAITGEGAVLITLDQASTLAFIPGNYYFEVTANPYVYGYSSWGGIVNPPYPPTFQRVANGTLVVADPPGYSDFLVSGQSTVVSQDAQVVDIVWVAGDYVSLAFTVSGVNWAGSYISQVRTDTSPTATLMGSFVVTAVYDGANTLFTLTMSAANSALIPAGNYYWDIQQVGGLTRLRGSVRVLGQVSV